MCKTTKDQKSGMGSDGINMKGDRKIMNMDMMMKITEMVEKCPVCGDDTVGNGSRFIIEENTFERTCRECGWKITGEIKDDEIVVTSDNQENAKELFTSRRK